MLFQVVSSDFLRPTFCAVLILDLVSRTIYGEKCISTRHMLLVVQIYYNHLLLPVS